MPIVTNQLIVANAHLAGYAIAKDLALLTVEQFGEVRLAHVGIGDASCCAAVAVVPNAGAGYGGIGPPYSATFGNSRLAPGGLVPEIVGAHAERAALTAAGNAGLALYVIPGSNDAVLFVELSPCGGCAAWLNGGGGGVANPYNGVINGAGATTLNVWYRWAYTAAGVAAMNAFHASSVTNQTADILTNW